MRSFCEHRGRVFTVAFSPDGHWLAAGGTSPIVSVWDTSSWDCALKITHALNKVRCLTFHPRSELLAIAGRPNVRGEREKLVSLWSVPEGVLKRQLSLPGGGKPLGLAYYPAGDRLFLYSNPSISLHAAPIFVDSVRRLQGFRLFPRQASFHKPEAPAKESFPFAGASGLCPGDTGRSIMGQSHTGRSRTSPVGSTISIGCNRSHSPQSRGFESRRDVRQ